MKIDSKSIKMWSRVGSRATFGMAAVELAKECDELMVLTSDVSTSAGLERYRRTYPEKFLDVGIAEQNLIGIAAGLASEGKLVVTATFAPFQTMRCCEQIRVNLGYMGHKVCTGMKKNKEGEGRAKLVKNRSNTRTYAHTFTSLRMAPSLTHEWQLTFVNLLCTVVL